MVVRAKMLYGCFGPRVKTHPFVSECIIALYSNSALPALDGYIVTLEIDAYAQHYHCDTEQCHSDTDVRSKPNTGLLTLDGAFTKRRCAQT